jgi:hypothetical protein
MFKKITLLIIIVIGFNCFSFAQESEDSHRIFWSDWYKLEWSDFQAEPDFEKESIAAQSNLGLPYKMVSDGEGVMNVSVNVCFLKDESWSHEEKRNNVLLQHEQLHFDIAELHRRLIVKAIVETEFTKENHKELLDKTIRDIWLVKYREVQDKYDKETNFSRIIREQINWNKYIKQQLINLKEYTYTEVEVSLIQF